MANDYVAVCEIYEGVGVEVPAVAAVKSATINEQLGTTPGTWEVVLNGAWVVAIPQLADPNTPKTIRGGDTRVSALGPTGAQSIADTIVEFKELWLDTSNEDQQDLRNSVVTLRGHDDRIHWHARAGVYGARAYNVEYFGERPRQSGSGGGGGGNYGDNPRYPAHLYKTGLQIVNEIFSALGVPTTRRELAGQRGFLDLARGAGAVEQLSHQEVGVGVAIADDTPEWVTPEGTTPVEAMEKFQELYGIRIGRSPDGIYGFVGRADLARARLAAAARIEALALPPAADGVPRNPVRTTTTGTDRDDQPDVICIKGAPILLEGCLVLEPVVRDPDREGCYLPLYRAQTLAALGFFPQGGLPANGEATIRFAMRKAAQVNDAPEVPARLKTLAQDMFRLWRVALQLEIDLAAHPEWPAPATIVVDKDASNADGYRRMVSYSYRWLRTNAQSPAPSATASGDRLLYDPPVSSESAEPHRFLPLLPHRAARNADGTYAKPRVLGANVVLRRKTRRGTGAATADYVDVGFLPGVKPVGSTSPVASLAVDLGIEPRIIDPLQGVIDMGEPIFGCDGEVGQSRRAARRPVLAQGALDPVAPEVRDAEDHPGPRSRMAELLEKHGASLGSVWASTEAKGSQTPAPFGTPFLWLHCAWQLGSFPVGDLRGHTTCLSAKPPRRDDPWLADPRIVSPLFDEAHLRRRASGGAIMLAEAPGSWLARQLNITEFPLPELQLRCTTGAEKPLGLPPVAGLPVYLPNSFERTGGWGSGELTGVSNFQDTKPVDQRPAAAGEFWRISQQHYDDVLGVMVAHIQAQNAHIAEYRKDVEALNVLAADVCGWLRCTLPGVDGFEDAPMDGASFVFATEGKEVSATCRITANSRGYRTYVGSARARELLSRQSQAAQKSRVASAFGGGGGSGTGAGPGGIGLVAHAPTVGSPVASAPRAQMAESRYPKPGVGGVPACNADRRDPLAKGRTGGALHEHLDDVWHVGMMSGEMLSRRKGGRLYIHAPGDWRDEILEPVPNEDGRVYYENLDGLELYYGAPAREEYHPDVGKSQGTAHLPQEDFPLVRARLRGGPTKQRHGDISIVIPDHYYKRHLFPGANSQGGIVRTRGPEPILDDAGNPVLDPAGNPTFKPPLTPEAAAINRNSIVASTLVPLMIVPETPSALPGSEPTAGSPEPVAVLSGPGWCGILNLFHEDLSLNAKGNINLEGSLVPSPFGGKLDTNTVYEYLDIQPTTGAAITTASDCDLIPMTPPGGVRINLNDYSYQVGIALLAEIIESNLGGGMIQTIIANIEGDHALLRRACHVIRELWCILQTKLDPGTEVDAIAELFTQGRQLLPTICETECVRIAPEPTDEAPPPAIGGP